MKWKIFRNHLDLWHSRTYGELFGKQQKWQEVLKNYLIFLIFSLYRESGRAVSVILGGKNFVTVRHGISTHMTFISVYDLNYFFLAMKRNIYIYNWNYQISDQPTAINLFNGKNPKIY